jgi:hypothetical protein
VFIAPGLGVAGQDVGRGANAILPGGRAGTTARAQRFFEVALLLREEFFIALGGLLAIGSNTNPN